MSTTSMIDVLVVGAGPAGLTLACDLARYNKTIRIIDKLKVAPVGTRARGISPRSQEIFADLEILASLTEYAEPSLPWRIYNQDNQIVREIDHMAKLDPSMRPSPTEPYPLMLQVSQRYTDAILRDCLAS